MGNGQHLAYDDWLAVIADVRKHKNLCFHDGFPHAPSIADSRSAIVIP
jgi:hypothetical protein